MRTVFADTSYWVALLNPHDDLHTKAMMLSEAVQPAHIVTSEMVLMEVLNDFSDRGENIRQTATLLIKKLRDRLDVTVVPQTSTQFQVARNLYERHLDTRWSQAECVSFSIMDEYKITDALAYNKHFVQAGYTALLQNYQG